MIIADLFISTINFSFSLFTACTTLVADRIAFDIGRTCSGRLREASAASLLTNCQSDLTSDPRSSPA